MERKYVAIAILLILVISSIPIGYYFSNQTEVNEGTPTPNPKTTKSPMGPIPSLHSFYLGASRIFVVSANATYGNYPLPTITTPPSLINGGQPIARTGEPCVIIEATLRNDYSTDYPAPNSNPDNSTKTYVALNAALFSEATRIDARDITNAYPIESVSTNRAFTTLDYGENDTLTIYLATNNTDVTSFQLSGYYIGALTPP
jgi:hypothetical protein